MKVVWRRLAARIDGMTLRERTLVFAVAAALLLVLLQTAVLDNLFSRQKILSQRLNEQQNKISGIDGEIVQKLRAFDVDPDLASRGRLQQLQQQSQQLGTALRSMEKGLVAPDRISPLLEAILTANGHLHLQSLKTLAPAGATPPARAENAASRGIPANPAAPALANAAPGLIYRHGVEIVVRGEYLELLAYLTALEAMPAQLFWGSATLSVDNYPNASLALSVYTLSLDQKWIKL